MCQSFITHGCDQCTIGLSIFPLMNALINTKVHRRRFKSKGKKTLTKVPKSQIKANTRPLDIRKDHKAPSKNSQFPKNGQRLNTT